VFSTVGGSPRTGKWCQKRTLVCSSSHLVRRIFFVRCDQWPPKWPPCTFLEVEEAADKPHIGELRHDHSRATRALLRRSFTTGGSAIGPGPRREFRKPEHGTNRICAQPPVAPVATLFTAASL
jgi:hypothetical protein